MSDNTATRIVILEVVLCIFFAAFIRLDSSDLTNLSSLLPCFLFLFGFALLNASRNRLSLTTLGSLLIVLCLTLQWNVFWNVFFNSCFQNSFSNSITVSVKLLLQSFFCVLCITISLTDLAGKYTNLQMIAVVMVQSIGFSLASASLNYGFKTLDGGAGLQVFFLSACLTIGKWVVYFRPDSKAEFKPHSTNYPQQVLSFIGLIFVIASWPGFNYAGCLFTLSNTLLEIAYLQGSAFITTILTLGCAIVCSLGLASVLNKEKTKMPAQEYIDAILSAGFLVACSANVVIDPVAGLILGCFASITTILIHRLLVQKVSLLQMFPGVALRLLYSGLGSIVCSVIIITRSDRTPTLSKNLSNQALYIFLSMIVTAAIGLLFGCISGFLMKYFDAPIQKQMGQDKINWQVREDQYPLFKNTVTQAQRDLLDSVRGGNNRLNNSLLPLYAQELNFRSADKKKPPSENNNKQADPAIDKDSQIGADVGGQANPSKPYLKIIQDSVVNKSVNYLLYNSNKKNQVNLQVQPTKDIKQIVSQEIP